MRTEVRLAAGEQGEENASMNNIHEIVLFRRATAPWWFAMGIASSVLVVAILLIPVFTFAQDHAVITPGQLVWKPLIPGVEMAVVSGDPDKKSGLYVIRIRSKGEVKVPPHWHPTDEHITVLAGSFLVARGDKYDAAKLVELKAGAHSVMPATMPHFGLHKAGNVIEVYGEGPFAPTFINPEDDPNSATKKK
jgi:mannose-6-phosphate isomerase-like protein (cupin superfamily)